MNPHDVNPDDLVVFDMRAFVPACPVCGGKDWYAEGGCWVINSSNVRRQKRTIDTK
jgi:hypothetical protein